MRAVRLPPSVGSKGGIELPRGGIPTARGTVISRGRMGPPTCARCCALPGAGPPLASWLNPAGNGTGEGTASAAPEPVLVLPMYPRGCRRAAAAAPVVGAAAMPGGRAADPAPARAMPLTRPGVAPRLPPLRIPPPPVESLPMRACALADSTTKAATAAAHSILEIRLVCTKSPPPQQRTAERPPAQYIFRPIFFGPPAEPSRPISPAAASDVSVACGAQTT